MNGTTFWPALARILRFVGVLSFFSPAGWRRMFEQMLRLSDGAFRFF
ncbi:MAG: DUF2065 family protein [Polaromonas sp.]|nr:DUF2065 family protein [Polaromonas sp.]MDP2255186.1 DUF2065 family protein [Polaromonas sp.]